ncbi:unnamed protein product [Microthlaspi erraticum]|uniref:Uncharacterized protein n=1 Tax=Microthlaspi erraticum TaxID=1685480 RepID=A0A6D2I6F3_9BRAS|nr:unnamed protein product [Microthlaspi erraticum]
MGINQEGGQGKYLGLPEAFGRKKKDLFSAVVDRIRQRAILWSSKMLSGTGKVVLLKSVLSSMLTYSMSCFKLPHGINSHSGKREGGLGLRDIQGFSDALLSKLSWRILSNPDCLLARLLKGKYFPELEFLEYEMNDGGSHGWKGIMIGRDPLKGKLGKVIGNGKSTSVWDDPWLSTKEPKRPMGPTPEHTKDMKEVWRQALFRNQIMSGGLTNIKAGISALNEAISLPPTRIRAGTLAPWIM